MFLNILKHIYSRIVEKYIVKTIYFSTIRLYICFKMFMTVHDMYDVLCYSCENENKLVEICFI